jgi:diguanylate cyclase (GGDEF)-like protein
MTPAYLIGQYDTGLVLLSYLVASLAAYTAIDLAPRISQNPRRQWLWLALGAIAMGMGIWSMHFIGMQAFSLPIALGYDLIKTVLSLLAGIAVAALALYVASRASMGIKAIATGAVLMGIGICVMHYSGMYAMEMNPGIDWNPLLVVASLVVAVTGSGAALWIVFNLRRVNPQQKAWARLGAAAIMGFAVVGMHYTGMAAAKFPLDSICGAADSLNGTWTGVPLAAFTAALIALTTTLTAHDARVQARIEDQRRQREQEERIRTLALYDATTHLRNRASFQQEIVQLIQRCERSKAKFDLFYGVIRFPGLHSEESIHEAMRGIAERLRPLAREQDFLARYGKNEFALLRPRLHEADVPRALRAQLLTACTLPLQIGDAVISPQAHVGCGSFPDDGLHSRQLLQAAARSPQQATAPLAGNSSAVA